MTKAYFLSAYVSNKANFNNLSNRNTLIGVHFKGMTPDYLVSALGRANKK